MATKKNSLPGNIYERPLIDRQHDTHKSLCVCVCVVTFYSVSFHSEMLRFESGRHMATFHLASFARSKMERTPKQIVLSGGIFVRKTLSAVLYESLARTHTHRRSKQKRSTTHKKCQSTSIHSSCLAFPSSNQLDMKEL